MPVVSNTSPLLNLAIIGELNLLRDQFGVITIPSAVHEELRTGEDIPGTEPLRAAIKAGWIQIVEVEQKSLVRSLCRDLDKGEAEAITLAIQEKAEWVIIDERDGRKIARLMGLKIVGLLGILLKASRQGTLSLEQAMDNLQKKAGFYIQEDLYRQLLDRK